MDIVLFGVRERRLNEKSAIESLLWCIYAVICDVNELMK